MFAVPEGAVVLEASRLTETSAERPQVEAIVQLTPAQFEAAFVSIAHTEAEIDATVDAAAEAFAIA